MNKFKKIFYGIYLIYLTVAAFVAVYYEDLVLRWDWDTINTWVGLLRFVLKLGGLGLVLFILEIVIENIHLYSKSSKIKSLEIEVLDLKAKLYDKTERQQQAIKHSRDSETVNQQNLSRPQSRESLDNSDKNLPKQDTDQA